MPVLSPQPQNVIKPPVENWCNTCVKVIRLSHKFLISSFRCRTGALGEAIESSTFSSCESDKMHWRLKVYLNGKSEESKDYIGLYLELVSQTKTEVQAKYTFSILSSDQEKKHKWVSSITAFVQGTDIGCPNFLKRDFLSDEANGLLMDDKLTICCDVDVISDIITGPTIPVKLNIPDSHLSKDFGKLFQSRKFCDVVINVNGHELYAHKNILSARSAVFAAMFEHKMKESKESKVDITDMNYETVKEMLSYIYTGTVPNVAEKAADLLVAANKYALNRLKVMCEAALFTNLSINNAPNVLVLADMHNASMLKAHVIDFIILNGADIMHTSGWKSMELHHPHLLTEICMASAVPVIKSMSHNQINVTKSSYIWVFDNFSFSIENWIHSSIFSSGSDEQKWCLVLDPSSSGEENECFVSLNLKLMSQCKSKVSTKFDFQILNASLKTVKFSGDEDEVITFIEEFDYWGYEEFVARKFLLNESNGLLTNDRLILRCNLTVFSEPVNISTQNCAVQFKVPACDLSDDFGKLFESQKFSDVTLSVNGHELNAHKNVLSARSPVFAVMFQHEMEAAKHNTVQIVGVDCEVFKEMLCFIYTGKAPNLEKMTVDLLVVADRYALDRLKLMCDNCLFSNLCVDNACDFLILADKHGADQLKFRTIDFISFHVDAVVHSNGWKTLEKHHAHLMTEVCGVLLKQLDLPKRTE